MAPHALNRPLNHVQGTISGCGVVYQRQHLLAERKGALEAWAEFVAGLG